VKGAAAASAPARFVRLRPSVHYAPLDDGILFKCWDRSFTVEGHGALYGLFERLLPILDGGVEHAALLAAVPEHARAVVALLLDRLEEHGMCLAAPRRGPSAREAAAFAQTIAYLEGVAADPEAAFARVRAARVAVEGGGVAGQAAIRALASLGVGNLAGADPETLRAHPLVCETSPGDVDLTLRLHERAPGAPRGAAGALLEGVLADDVALLGPLRHGDGPGLADAVARWKQPLAFGRPAPVLAALLGNVAAYEVFRVVAGLPAQTADGKVAAITREPLRIGHHPVVALEPRPLLEPGRGASSAPGADEVVADVRALADEQTGIIAPPHPEDLPQLPLFTCRSGEAIGFGDDPTEAYLRAGFAALRAALVPPRAGLELAVAPTHDAWLEEGVLACLLPRLLRHGVAREVAFADVVGPTALLWKTLRLRFAQNPRVVHVASPAWPGVHLVAVLDGGETAGAGVGLNPAAAAHDALREAVARAQLAEVGVALPARPRIEAPPGGDAPWDLEGSLAGLRRAGVAVETQAWHGPRRALVIGWVGVHV
jgi:hypothetical protein